MKEKTEKSLLPIIVYSGLAVLFGAPAIVIILHFAGVEFPALIPWIK
jgi:hypothetical protein